jgi:hypothetical protein
MKKSLAIALTAVALLGSLTACTSGDSTADAAPAATVQAPAPIPSIPAGKGIISSTQMTSHHEKAGELATASGTVTMPKGESGQVAISVSWVNAATSTVYARGVTVLSGLAAGDSQEWTVSAQLPADAVDLMPVLGAVIVGAAK